VLRTRGPADNPGGRERKCGGGHGGSRGNTADDKKTNRKTQKEAAPGPDEVTPGLLKMLEEEVLLPLEIIFNKSLTTAQVPSEWKTANVTPIFKK
jgi:hypothetical protein